MKLNVYKEQYKSKQAYTEPGKIGFGYSIDKVTNVANNLVEASNKVLEQNDEIDAARLEAETLVAADKLFKEYEKTADPDNFLGDVERQQQTIRNLIDQQSQKLRLSTSRNNFKTKMTRGLETKYMGDTLRYSYAVQEEHYKKKVAELTDPIKAGLLSGSTFITLPDAIENASAVYTGLGNRYNMPKVAVQSYIDSQVTDLIKSYSYGMIDKNPEIVRELLVGNGFEKYKAYKESLGQGFSMDEFWQNDELRKEYAESDFAAQYTDYARHLDYDTRVDLWRLANSEIERRAKEEANLKLKQNAISSYELDQRVEAAKAYGREFGKLPLDAMGTSEVTSADVPGLGSKNVAIAMGDYKIGYIAKGNRITNEAKAFAGGISGRISQLGYQTYLTSNVRPGDHDSRHKDGSAIDIQAFKTNSKTGKREVSIQGLIEQYKAAVALYGNNMRKGGTLFEVNPAQLDFIKSQLESDGTDTSFINWAQSRKYGADAYARKAEHIHFGINPKADYTKTNAGKGIDKITFRTQLGKPRFIQLVSEGKSIQDAYDATRKEEFEILSAVQEKAFINRIVNHTNADGSKLDPAYYGRVLEQQRQEVMNNKSLSSEERLIRLTAINNAKSELPKLQQMFREDTTNFMIASGQASTPEEAAKLQVKYYNISPSNVSAVTAEEAKTKADELYSKLPPEQAVAYVRNASVTPGTLKQIAKYMPDDSKSNMIMYSNMASPALAEQIIAACRDWDTTSKIINQKKDIFVTGWDARVISQFRKNPIIKGYLNDVEAVAPQEAAKLLDAMKAIYAHKMTHGGTNSDSVVKYIAENLIGSSFNAATVYAPRQGRTTVTVAKNFTTSDIAKITRACNLIMDIGLSKDAVDIPIMAPVSGTGPAANELRTQNNINRNIQINNMLRNSRLNGVPDGSGAIFTWQDARGISSNTAIHHKGTHARIVFSFRDLIKAYDEAVALRETWRKKSKYYDDDVYTIPGYGKYTTAHPTADKALDAALEHVLTNRYKYLNKTPYTKFTKQGTTGQAANIEGFRYTGNINLYNRPQVKNADGSISTVRTISVGVNIDGKQKQMLIPTVSNEGKIMSTEEAYKYWSKRKQHLGIYNTKQEADEAAQLIHEQQQSYYLGD